MYKLFFLLLMAPSVQAQNFSAKKTKEGVEIIEKGKPVLFFQSANKTVEGKYARAGFVHPLYDLGGNIISDDAPKDHPYHRGIFWAWHQVIVNGKNVGDGWMSDNIYYKPLLTDVKTNQKAVLHSQMIWNAKINDKVSAVAKQKTSITIFPSTTHYRIMDFCIVLIPLVKELKLGGSDDLKGYGGFSVRLKLPGDISFVSDDKQITPEETAVNAGPWMDITGSFPADSLHKSGIAIFGYPKGNKNNPWILRRVTSMQNIPYPGRVPAVVPKDGLKLNYRMVVHDDTVNTDTIEKLYKEWAK
ncbi:MAG TPA: DUF6807 family protein [Flavitalea sp.]|nr:DUF6807 family protein [Flavitalea sp.]